MLSLKGQFLAELGKLLHHTYNYKEVGSSLYYNTFASCQLCAHLWDSQL